jgi:hypothetical protein
VSVPIHQRRQPSGVTSSRHPVRSKEIVGESSGRSQHFLFEQPSIVGGNCRSRRSLEAVAIGCVRSHATTSLERFAVFAVLSNGPKASFGTVHAVAEDLLKVGSAPKLAIGNAISMAPHVGWSPAVGGGSTMTSPRHDYSSLRRLNNSRGVVCVTTGTVSHLTQ